MRWLRFSVLVCISAVLLARSVETMADEAAEILNNAVEDYDAAEDSPDGSHSHEDHGSTGRTHPNSSPRPTGHRTHSTGYRTHPNSSPQPTGYRTHTHTHTHTHTNTGHRTHPTRSSAHTTGHRTHPTSSPPTTSTTHRTKPPATTGHWTNPTPSPTPGHCNKPMECHDGACNYVINIPG